MKLAPALSLFVFGSDSLAINTILETSIALLLLLSLQKEEK